MPERRAADYRPAAPRLGAGDSTGQFPLARRPRSRWRILRALAGFLLLLLGVIGLFLPVLQGVLMIAAGLAVLGRDLPWARAVTDRLKAFVLRRPAAGRCAGSAGSDPA